MNAVARQGVSIALACRAFEISETCYRYSPVLSDENEEIADWLERLTANKRNWGFGLCFLYLRNVQGYAWNHKRVYRIYCELELNLRIKPKKRLKRDKPEPQAVPERPNETWSMDFMADQLADGRLIRTLNVLDDFNRWHHDGDAGSIAARRACAGSTGGLRATGGSAFTLGPSFAQVLAALIAGRQPDMALTAFDPARYGRQ